MYAYWVGHAGAEFNSPLFPNQKRDPKWGDMEFQHRNWYSFVWICGDQIVEQHLHNIDVCNWFMGTHPVEVVASGGAAWRPREEEYGNIYDHIAADFVYPNGVHMASHCRQYPGQRHRAERQRADRRHQGRDRQRRPLRGARLGGRSLRAGAHRHDGQHPRQGPVHQRGDGGRGEHHDLPHGPRGGLLRPEDHLGHDDELAAGPAAEDPSTTRTAVPVPPLPVPGVYKFV